MDSLNLNQILNSTPFYRELDIPADTEIEFILLGAGEYNINYLFTNPASGKKLVLRIPTGSQMRLKNQVRYEYEALKLLEPSKRTPKPLYIDDTGAVIPYGFMVMDYLPGKALQYENDMEIAAQILAEIHNIEIPGNSHLMEPSSPLEAILEECNSMAKKYFDYSGASNEAKLLIKELLESGKDIIEKSGEDYGSRCIINTELNSGNFLINGKGKNNYLIDWEKPLLAYAGQDLGHFLAPTTTFWKTDIMLTKNDIYQFMDDYCKCSGRYIDPARLWEATLPYFTITCLRGITWCAMAKVEYDSPNRPIKNEFTYDKIQTYLTPNFLELIRNEYMGGQ